MIPVIETERLILRGPEMRDFEPHAEFYTTARSSALGGPCPRHDAWTKFVAAAGQWLLRGYGYWTLEEKATGRVLGRVGVNHPEYGLEPELAWTLFTGAEGQGFANEAALAARDHAGRVMGLGPLMSTIRADNARSLVLAARLGARFESDWASPWGPLGIWRHPAVGGAA